MKWICAPVNSSGRSDVARAAAVGAGVGAAVGVGVGTDAAGGTGVAAVATGVVVGGAVGTGAAGVAAGAGAGVTTVGDLVAAVEAVGDGLPAPMFAATADGTDVAADDVAGAGAEVTVVDPGPPQAISSVASPVAMRRLNTTDPSIFSRPRSP